MSIYVRKSHERGQADHGWLQSRFTFSFADYYDPRFMGFRSLRVINEDDVAPGQGFGTHPHRDMEILTYVVEGAVAHKDSMGNASTIKAGEVQKMSAGTGIMHSEFNPSKSDKLHLLQIWIVPDTKGITPNYEQYALPVPDDRKPLQLIASAKGGTNIIRFYQDVELFRGVLGSGAKIDYPVKAGRGIWVQVVKGSLDVNGQALTVGDAAAIEEESAVILKSGGGSEFLLFDLG